MFPLKFINNVNLSVKLPIIIALFGIISCVGVSGYFLTENTTALKIEGPKNLERTTESTLIDMEHYVEYLEDSLMGQADWPEVLRGIREMGKTFTTPARQQVYNQYRGFFQQYIKKKGYADLYLMDKQGNIIFSVAKQADYGTNIKNGVYKNTGLGKAYRLAMSPEGPDHAHMADFAPYSAMEDKIFTFMAHRVVDEKDETLGTIAIRLEAHHFDKFMKSIGHAGEVSMVAADRYYRSNSVVKGQESTNRILKQQLHAVFADVLQNANKPEQPVQTVVENGQTVYAQKGRTLPQKASL